MILQLRWKEKNYEDSWNVTKKINHTLKEHLSENQSMDNKGIKHNERQINTNVVLNGTTLETVHGAAIYLEVKFRATVKYGGL